MIRQRYAGPSKCWCWRWWPGRTSPARVMAQELGIPRDTRSEGREAARQHPAEPSVGSGQLRADAQRLHDRERPVHDLQEENAIRKPATRLVAKGHQSGSGSFPTTASPSRARRGVRFSMFREAGMTLGPAGCPARAPRDNASAWRGFGRSTPQRSDATGAPRSPPSCGERATV